MRRGLLHCLLTGRLYFEGDQSRKESRVEIVRLHWRLDLFRVKAWLWKRTPWWTEDRECGCKIRLGRYRVLTCLDHVIADLGFTRADLEDA